MNGFLPAFANQPDDEFFNDASPSANHAGHIALLLPFDSPSLKQAALAVQKGIENAAKLEPDFILEIIPYPTDGTAPSALSAYQQAVENGAEMIIGPMTRDGVDALASSYLVSQPTLALNYPTSKMISLPASIFFFGLNVESEAQHVARMAATSGRRHAVILADRSELSKRLKAAFADMWLQIDPDFSAEDMEISSPKKLSMLSRQNDDNRNVIFFALNAFNSESVRPFIRPGIPVYATSLVFGNKDPAHFEKLEAVRFTDMPWLIQTELASIQHYYSPDIPVDISLQRFYALGIDAFQLALKILEYHSPGAIVLDGISGFIHLDLPNYFNRRPVSAIFRQGRIVPDN